MVARAGALRIRRKHKGDFAQDYAWRLDPELARFDGNAPTDMSFEEFVRRVEPEALWDGHSRKSFSIETQDGVHIGNVMFYNVGPAGERAEIGLTIADADWQGRGNGAALTVAFLRYLWTHHPFRRIDLRTLAWNERAVRCFARAGFEEVGRAERAGEAVICMEARREWWLLWDAEGRFDFPAGRDGGDSGV